MKPASLIFLLLLSFQTGHSQAWASSDPVQNFNDLFNQSMLGSDGELLNVYCASHSDPTEDSKEEITCVTDIQLTDPSSDFQSLKKETCREIHTYSGGFGFETLCSTCDYSKIYLFHSKICVLNF